jgi:deoxyribodipyrimidine photo-lyase
MSSPLSAQESCSRLSPHLAFGTVSMREAAQAAWTGRDKARAAGNEALAASLASFLSRLHWHCHFIQKLEDDTTLERRSLHPAYDGLRPDPAADDPVFGAWQTGRTGFPFLDACMRSLQATGWLNFRMRALLMSFVSYQLWFNWRRPGVHLARLFTDFEPGIHYPQVQMQSASTGVNTARIYNPLKQSHDQDPEGVFIRTWVPELAGLPTAALHAPWERGVDVEALGYVARIVDHEQAGRMARERIWSPRKGTAYRAVADAIQARHGSRRSGLPPTGPRQPQLDLITPLTRSGRTSPRKDAPNAP